MILGSERPGPDGGSFFDNSNWKSNDSGVLGGRSRIGPVSITSLIGKRMSLGPWAAGAGSGEFL